MKSPAFRFFPSDFWGSPDVQAMDLHEVGAYLSLLSMAWLSERHGYLQDDDRMLRRWARMSLEQWEQSRDLLLKKFPVVEPGWRANPRLVQVADQQATYAESQKRKAELRWSNRAGQASNDLHTSNEVEVCHTSNNDAPAYAPVSKTDAGGMPSVSVSVSSSKEQKQLLSFPGGKVNDGAESPKKGKVRHSYDPSFEVAWQAYPKHEEKAEGAGEWKRAVSRLCAGDDPDLEPMTPEAAADYLVAAVRDFAHRKADKETQFVTAMCRWLKKRVYLDYRPKVQTDDWVTTADGQRVKKSDLDGWSVTAEVA